MVHAGCWAHARRYFFQAVQLNRRDLLALGIVAEIDKLFELEAEAKAAGLGAAERLGLRRKKAEPIVEGLKGGVESARASTLPRSALGKACDDALGRLGQLRRFPDYGQLELSNNLAENAIRPVAIGRKNWLHVGSERAGPRVAAIISIVETCRRLSIPVRNYLSSVLPGLASFPINRIAELTPTAWAARISRLVEFAGQQPPKVLTSEQRLRNVYDKRGAFEAFLETAVCTFLAAAARRGRAGLIG
jgi:transposase